MHDSMPPELNGLDKLLCASRPSALVQDLADLMRPLVSLQVRLTPKALVAPIEIARISPFALMARPVPSQMIIPRVCLVASWHITNVGALSRVSPEVPLELGFLGKSGRTTRKCTHKWSRRTCGSVHRVGGPMSPRTSQAMGRAVIAIGYQLQGRDNKPVSEPEAVIMGTRAPGI